MRHAIKTAPQLTTFEAMLEVWRAADDIELFESAWNFDHFEPIIDKPRNGPCLEGWTSLAALAQATSRIRIGCMVTGMPYRHPSLLANMAATVDVISGGRLELGLGAGWNQAEADALGIELPPLKERFDRFDEGLEVVTRLLRDDIANFSGEHFSLVDAFCEPKPIQRPNPPIWIGGDGPRRTLRAVARHADYWNTPFASPESFARSLEILHGHCEEIGRDPSDITVTAQVIHDPATGGAATRERVEELGEAGCELVVLYLPETHHNAAEVEAIAEALR